MAESPHHSDVLEAASSPERVTRRPTGPRGGGRRVQAWQVAGGVLALLAGGLLAYAFWPVLAGQLAEEQRPQVPPAAEAGARVEAVVVAPGDFAVRAEATGHLASWRRAEISAESSGLVVARPVEEGQAVQAGHLLVHLDDRDQRIELQEAEAELLKARAEYAVSISNDGAAPPADTTRLALARAAFREAEDAFARGVVSQDELREVRRRFEAAEVLAGKQRGAVQAVSAGLTQAEQRAERTRLALERTRITAPFAGRVADVEVEQGQRVAAGQVVLTLLDDARMKVEVDVLEADLVRIDKGATARVRVPALGPDRFAGTIYAVNPAIDPKTGTGRVTVAIPNPQRRLIAGLFAYVELETQRLRDRLVVPADAVLVRQGRDLVFRVEQGRAQWVYVTVGRRSGEHVEIVEGIAPGDTVAVAGHFALAHDAPVEVTLRGGED